MTLRQTAPAVTSPSICTPVKSTWWVTALLLTAMVLSWSSGFIGYRYVATQSGVFLATFWRFLLAAVVLLPFVVDGLRKLAWRDMVRQALVGLFAIGGYIAPIAKAIEWGVAPGTTALIANLLPLVILLMSGFIPGQRMQGWQWFGLGICLLGMLIASGTSLELGHAPGWAYAVPLLGVLSLAVATTYQKSTHAPPVPGLVALFIQVCAILPLFALLAAHEGSLRPIAGVGFGLGVVWLVLFSTLGGYGFYWLCVQRFSVQRISSVLFLIPPVTMFWASLQFGDALAPGTFVGVGLTLVGLPFLNRRS